MKLTKRIVDALKATDRDRIVFDDKIAGFGLRIKPSGCKSYLIQYRNEGGRTRRLTLGKHGPLTTEKARELARRRLGEVEDGADPSAERRSIRGEPTVGDLAERYLEEHAHAKKKAASIEADGRLLRLYVVPEFGRRKVGSLTGEDIGRLHHSLRETPFQANRVLALLSKMLNLAERWGLRPQGSNPCRHIERFRERRRERFLTGAELTRLGEVLSQAERDETESPSAILALRLLLLTGARKSEILRLRWEEVSLERRCLCLSDSKTGEKTIPLSAPALELLAAAPRVEGNPYVCPGDRACSALVGLHRPWARLRARGGPRRRSDPRPAPHVRQRRRRRRPRPPDHRGAARAHPGRDDSALRPPGGHSAA